jgi:hypothetical protein
MVSFSAAQKLRTLVPISSSNSLDCPERCVIVGGRGSGGKAGEGEGLNPRGKGGRESSSAKARGKGDRLETEGNCKVIRAPKEKQIITTKIFFNPFLPPPLNYLSLGSKVVKSLNCLNRLCQG